MSRRVAKRYAIPASKIREIAPGRGSCIASDLIVVDGKPVGYMYREQPDLDHDSGWRFFSGAESEAYVGDAENFAFYDVNTIANYDRTIIPLLDASVGSAFERDDTGVLVAVPFPADPDDD